MGDESTDMKNHIDDPGQWEDTPKLNHGEEEPSWGARTRATVVSVQEIQLHGSRKM